MKEFEYIFSDGLFKGLKSGNEIPMNSDVLEECFNLEPTPNGLIPHQYVVDIRTMGSDDLEVEHPEVGELGNSFVEGNGDWSDCWPWPQIRELTNGTILGLARLDGSDNLGIFNLVTINNVYTPTQEVNIGNIDSIIGINIDEFFGYFMIGVQYNDGTVASWTRGLNSDYIEPVDLEVMPEFGAVGIYNGQAIIGDIVAGEGSVWPTGESVLLWAKPGTVEFDPTEERSAGWISQVECGGRIVKIQPLVKSVLVFTTKGICMLVPNEFGFSCNDLGRVGVASCRHVAGSKNFCTFLDNNYDLWAVSGDCKFTKLGYRHLLRKDNISPYYEELLKWNICGDKNSGRFYISNGVEGYVYNGFQLYASHQCVSSVRQFESGGLGGIVIDTGDMSGYLKSGPQDLKQLDSKTIGFMEFGGVIVPTDCDNSTVISMGVDYAYDSKTFVDGGYRICSPEGLAYIGITASRFKFKVKLSNYRDQDLSLRYIKARVKVSDKRSIRGVQNASYVGA